MDKTLKLKEMAATEHFINELTEEERMSRQNAAFMVACAMMNLAATQPEKEIKALRSLLGMDEARKKANRVSVGGEVDEDTFNNLCLNGKCGAVLTILATPGTNTDEIASVDMGFGMSFYDPTHDHIRLKGKSREIVERLRASDKPRIWIELDRVAELFHVKPECLIEECVKAAMRRKQKEVAND